MESIMNYLYEYEKYYRRCSFTSLLFFPLQLFENELSEEKKKVKSLAAPREQSNEWNELLFSRQHSQPNLSLLRKDKSNPFFAAGHGKPAKNWVALCGVSEREGGSGLSLGGLRAAASRRQPAQRKDKRLP